MVTPTSEVSAWMAYPFHCFQNGFSHVSGIINLESTKPPPPSLHFQGTYGVLGWSWIGNYLISCQDVGIPANLPKGILLSMGPPFLGSDHTSFPISVRTTVGFTAFTRIYTYKQRIYGSMIGGEVMSTYVLPASCMLCVRQAVPKITLRFPHLYISSYICASTLITCAIITLHRLLPCDLTLIVDFANLDGCFV